MRHAILALSRSDVREDLTAQLHPRAVSVQRSDSWHTTSRLFFLRTCCRTSATHLHTAGSAGEAFRGVVIFFFRARYNSRSRDWYTRVQFSELRRDRSPDSPQHVRAPRVQRARLPCSAERVAQRLQRLFAQLAAIRRLQSWQHTAAGMNVLALDFGGSARLPQFSFSSRRTFRNRGIQILRDVISFSNESDLRWSSFLQAEAASLLHEKSGPAEIFSRAISQDV